MITVQIRVNGSLVGEVECVREESLGARPLYGEEFSYSIRAEQRVLGQAGKVETARSMKITRSESPFNFVAEMLGKLKWPSR